MSPRLAVSAALSILMMTACVLFGTEPAPDPFGAPFAGGETRVATPEAAPALPELSPGLLR